MHDDSHKTRYELVPAIAHEELAKVMTYGLTKYGKDNWRKGISWTSIIGSMERHLNAFKMGQTFDRESGLMHLGHLMANASFLIEYYYTHPELDDRVLVPRLIGDESNWQHDHNLPTEAFCG